MGAISGLVTTYNSNNYTGELINLTPAETPLLNIAGRNPGQVKDVEIEWQTTDLRANAQNVALEGADAPTAAGRTRTSVTNVVEVHHSAVSVSYTKLAAVAQTAGIGSVGATQPVQNESAFQIQAELTSMARDVEWSFLHGVYQKPSDNLTPRKTRGLLSAITTNLVNKGTDVTGITSATDTLTKTSHGVFSDGDKVVFTALGTLAANVVEPWQVYYIVASAANTFKVSATSGGAAITLGTATGIGITKLWSTALTIDHLGEFAQGIWDNGGLRSGTRAFLVNSRQKRAVSKACADAYAKATPVKGTIGGVSVTVVDTDFGEFAIVLHDLMPKDAIAAVTVDELQAVFLETPGKGYLFVEALAKTGAADKAQLYGEVGLKYGAEKHHGLLRGLAF